MKLIEAKERCLKKIGRLPRLGHEVCVLEDRVEQEGRTYRRKTYLANPGGCLRVWQWVDVNTVFGKEG